MSGKAEDDGPNAWIPATYVGDPDEVLGSQPQPGSSPDLSLSFSLPVPHSLSLCLCSMSMLYVLVDVKEGILIVVFLSLCFSDQ